RTELTLLPERLREAVLSIRVRSELEQLLVRLGGLGPVAGGGLADGLLGQLALQAGGGGGAGAGVDLGEGHGGARSFRFGVAWNGCTRVRSRQTRRARR